MKLNAAITTLLKHSREAKKTIVLVTGVFDGLHVEHLNFLQKASKEGDVLIVAIESDVRVRSLKGEGRPVHSQEKRKKALEQLPEVSAVMILPEKFDTPADHIAFMNVVRPDVFAVSSHTAHLDKKQKIVASFGGELRVVHKHNPAVSTTILLQQQ